MRAAFAEIVDYAGLFPPATSSMVEAVVQYDRIRHSPDRWMLGRFVVAAPRLEELGRTLLAEEIALDRSDPWRLAVVIGGDGVGEARLLVAFRSVWEARGVVADAIEIKVASPADVATVDQLLPAVSRRYLEVPRGTEYREVVDAIGKVGAYAKLRTGGTTADLFPSAAEVAAFLAAAVAARVPFKATAGLHHPFRGSYPITYDPGAALQVMHGFVNVLVATAALMRAPDVAMAEAILADSGRGAFMVAGDAIAWRGKQFSATALAATHQQFFLGFGSCSFREPHDELDLERAG